MKIFSTNPDLQTTLLNRFVSYAKVWTESSSENADKGIMPSTERQRDFANTLSEELKKIGLKEVQVTEFGYVYGCLPATKGMENAPSFCLLAHMDTVEEVTGKDVKPVIHAAYDGTRIDLQCGVTLDIEEDAYLALDTEVTAYIEEHLPYPTDPVDEEPEVTEDAE
jgi:tripeptide aminopeptidase